MGQLRETSAKRDNLESLHEVRLLQNSSTVFEDFKILYLIRRIDILEMYEVLFKCAGTGVFQTLVDESGPKQKLFSLIMDSKLIPIYIGSNRRVVKDLPI